MEITSIINKLPQFHAPENDLIPGLPYDLALECLTRVPITSHPSLRLVSHLWNSTISTPSFFSFRRASNTAEHLIFLIQPRSPPPQTDHTIVAAETTSDFDDDHSKNKHGGSEGSSSSGGTGNNPLLLYDLNMYNLTSHKLFGISTIPTFSQFVLLPSMGKLVVLGGWDPSTLEPVSRVVLIDLATGTWSEGSPMPTARSFFACSAVGSATIYVAGGHDVRKNALRSAEVYDVLSAEWRALPPMAEDRDECYSLCFSEDDTKFWVVSGYGTESQGRFRPDAEVFDPEKGVWVTVNGLWPYSGITPKSTAVVTVDGRRRWWQVIGGEIREFDWEEREWKVLNMGRVPEWVNGLLSSSSSVCLVDVEDGKIFVMGNGEICGQQRALMMERNKEDNVKSGINWRWQHIDTCSTFFGFPFSASHLLI